MNSSNDIEQMQKKNKVVNRLKTYSHSFILIVIGIIIIVLIIFSCYYIFSIKKDKDNIVYPLIPTHYAIFTQLKDGRILKLGGSVPTLLESGLSAKLIPTNQSEIYNIKNRKFTVNDSAFKLNEYNVLKKQPDYNKNPHQFNHYANALLLKDGRVLIISSEENKAEIYNPDTGDVILSGNNFFQSRGYINMIEMLNNEVLIVSQNNYIIYNPKSDTINEQGTINNVNFNYLTHLVMLKNGNILITGNNIALIYNPVNNEFNHMELDYLRETNNQVLNTGIPVTLPDKTILFFGALSNSDKVLKFDEETEKFIIAGSLKQNRYSSIPLLLSNNNVFLLGTGAYGKKITLLNELKAFIKGQMYVESAKIPCEIYNTQTNTSYYTNFLPQLNISNEFVPVFLFNDEIIIIPDFSVYSKNAKYNYGTQIVEHIKIKD